MSVPLVIDTDPGVDDAFALALAAVSPEVDLRAVTTTFGNVDLGRTTENARRVLGLLGRDDVPIGRGADRPLVHPADGDAGDVHGDDGLGGTADAFHPLAPAPVGPALDVLVAALEAADEPVVLAAIGPLTDVALLLAARPDLAPRIARLVVMGGAVGVGGNVTAAAEFNLWCDPEAAHRVLAHPTVPTTLVPLDLTMRTTVDERWLDTLAASGPVGAALAGTRGPYLRRYGARLGAARIPLHDAVALLEAIVPGSLHTTPLALQVDVSLGPGRGGVIADRRGDAPTDAPTVDVALDADLDAVRDALLARLTGRD